VNTIAYCYGEKLAAPIWGSLRTGLAHGAVAALPGLVSGGLIGYGTSPKEYTPEQKAWRAAKSGLLGGLITGTGYGVQSGLTQDRLLKRLEERPGMVSLLRSPSKEVFGQRRAQMELGVDPAELVPLDEAWKRFQTSPSTWLSATMKSENMEPWWKRYLLPSTVDLT